MAKIKGICRNEDCIKLNEIQEVEKTEFICPECGEPLTPFGGDGGGGFWKKHGKKVTLAAIVLGILAGIGVAISLFSGPVTPPPSTPSVFVNKTDKDITISYKIDGINYSANIPSNEQYEIELIEDNEAQIYTSIEPADNVFLVNGNESYISTTLQDENVYTITLKPRFTDDEVEVEEEGKGEYYTYEGSTQNGKPHGNGTMTFVKKCVVPGSKGNIVAQPGEYAIGKWVNGEVNLVTLYQKSGNRTIITHK